jgi:hypothetical protein
VPVLQLDGAQNEGEEHIWKKIYFLLFVLLSVSNSAPSLQPFALKSSHANNSVQFKFR